jgi:hypothetical protein
MQSIGNTAAGIAASLTPWPSQKSSSNAALCNFFTGSEVAFARLYYIFRRARNEVIRVCVLHLCEHSRIFISSTTAKHALLDLLDVSRFIGLLGLRSRADGLAA